MNKEYKFQLIKEITDVNNKISRANELLLLGDIDELIIELQKMIWRIKYVDLKLNLLI